jgi:hypothetical protein
MEIRRRDAGTPIFVLKQQEAQCIDDRTLSAAILPHENGESLV